MTDKKKEDGLLKTGTSRLAKAGSAGQRQGTPRILIFAGILVVIAAYFLFRGSSGDVPSGIGENQSVVTTGAAVDSTADQVVANKATLRSSDVDIADQTTEIIPEKPDTSDKTAAPVVTKAPAPKPTPEPAPRKPKTQPKEPVRPGSNGSYAVQTGAFGTAINADKEAARLQKNGWEAQVRAGNNSNGQMVFRVWIGFFTSRQIAQDFINQNKGIIGKAIPVHR